MHGDNDDIEAILALARIPRTPDGPDWASASQLDVKLATRLITRDWKYAERVAKGVLKTKGGAIPYAHRRRVDEYIDDPGDEYDDARLAEDIRPTMRPRAGFKDAHFDDVISNIWNWVHEAAVRFNGHGAWRPYLSRVIASRVADHLKKRLVAGTTNNKDDTPAEQCSTLDRAEDFKLDGVFHAAADEVSAHLQVLCQDEFGTVVLNGLASYESYAEIAARAGKSKTSAHEKAQKILAKLPALADAIKVRKIINNNNDLNDLSEETRTFLVRLRIKYKGRRRSAPSSELRELTFQRWFERECSRPNTGQKCRRPSSLRVLDEPGRVGFRGPYVYGHHRRQQAGVPGARQELTAYLSGPVSRDHRSEFAKPNGNPPLVLPKVDGKSLRLAAYYIKRGRQKPYTDDAVSGNYRWLAGPASRATTKTRKVRRGQSSNDHGTLASRATDSGTTGGTDVMVAIAPKTNSFPNTPRHFCACSVSNITQPTTAPTHEAAYE